MKENNTVPYQPASIDKIAATTPGEITRQPQNLTDPLKYLSDVQVKLDFKLGEATITVEQLRQLKPGSSVALDLNRGLILDILLNGHVIGTGSLVEVDGALGIQIANLITE